MKSYYWPKTYKEALKEQLALKKKLSLNNRAQFKKILIAGVDVSYCKQSNELFSSVVILDYESLKTVETVSARERADFPYIPGLLSFREGSIVINALKKLRNKPDLLVFDGQGIAHPRGFGLASHMGVLLDTPSIGCAKSKLFGYYKEPGLKRGCYSHLTDKKTIIGSVLRTKDNVKPVFISPGHLIDVSTARKIMLKCTGKYRIPLPTRLAHIHSNKVRMKA